MTLIRLFKICIFLPQNIINKILFTINKIPTSNIKILGILRISSKGKVEFGTNVIIQSGALYNIIGGQTYSSIIVMPNAEFSVGNNVGISNSSFFCAKRIEIGNDVMIGGSCKFYDTDFHSLDLNKRMMKEDPAIKSGIIKINKGVFIGAHSIILKNVEIGENTIIGAGSVVSKNIPSNEIWAGNPIRFIRENPIIK